MGGHVLVSGQGMSQISSMGQGPGIPLVPNLPGPQPGAGQVPSGPMGMGPAMGSHDGVMGQPIGMGMMGAFGPGVGSALDREARATKGFEWSPDQPYDGPVNGTNGRGFEAAYPERFGVQEDYWREREWNGFDRQGDDYWRKAELDARWARNGWGRHEVLSGEQVAQMALEQQATTIMLRNVPNKL